jgi:hypothetical protein
MRLYREGWFEIAPSFGFTLVDEYSKAFLVGGKAQYNILDWLGVGVYAAAGITATTDLTDQTNLVAPRNIPGQPPLPNTGNVAPCGPTGGSVKPCGQAGTPGANVQSPNFADQVGRITFMVVPQVTAVPFRGKLALFEKLFVDTDAYLHLGAAIVGLEERAECGLTGPGNTAKTGVPTSCFIAGANGSSAATFQRAGRIAVAPSFGLGLAFYFNDIVSLGVEYRAFPFSWNRGGYDSKGGGTGGNFPDQKVDGNDQTFKFNQMISFNVGFLLGKRQTSD